MAGVRSRGANEGRLAEGVGCGTGCLSGVGVIGAPVGGGNCVIVAPPGHRCPSLSYRHLRAEDEGLAVSSQAGLMAASTSWTAFVAMYIATM